MIELLVWQGRMKLFGTIVYPKNKYLTLQFARGGKNVVCEDCFENMVSIIIFFFLWILDTVLLNWKFGE